ncbi:uncharacterized protein Triagg1_6520 [Trichoderma aggressivum f. europaeum]|uniref:Uncharacterized protein n=1 Tax=Trichoderma aggressivum f. europaeum TaxID=173218 RepID=A0AAE1IAP1_9HYPO|nr:hypothetical protein Triagg1_6520 [Trichoderma aggressivum f. europaeum]
MGDISMPKSNVEIETLYFDGSSLRTFKLDITVKTGVYVGWVSYVTISLFYGHTFIGEAILEDELVNTENYKGELYIELNGAVIQHMGAFRSFIRDIMPKPQLDACQSDHNPTARLEIIENGHKLTMAIDLHGIGSFKTTTPIIQLNGNSIDITFSMSNTTTVAIYFGQTAFRLENDESILANLSGDFCIYASGEESMQYHLTGEISQGCELSGKATLKGWGLKSYEKSWRTHAIREFQIEVDLDHMVIRQPE